MGYKNNDKCIEKAFDDERLFVVMTRDPQGARTVIDWISNSLFEQPDDKLREAFECALEMKNRYFEIRKRVDSSSDCKVD